MAVSQKEYLKNYYLANRDKLIKRAVDWSKNNPEKVKESSRKHRSSDKGKASKRNGAYQRLYGISLEDYESKLIDQDYKCAICKSSSPNRITSVHFAVDHDHDSGKVRGLLCDKCNVGLGRFDESIKTLKSAIEYLGG